MIKNKKTELEYKKYLKEHVDEFRKIAIEFGLSRFLKHLDSYDVETEWENQEKLKRYTDFINEYISYCKWSVPIAYLQSDCDDNLRKEMILSDNKFFNMKRVKKLERLLNE